MSYQALFTRSEPVFAIWDVDPLLASLVLRASREQVQVVEFLGESRDLAHGQSEAPAADDGIPDVLLVGPSVLREASQLRFLHKLHRTDRVFVIACGRLTALGALVACEVGVAATVTTLHDAIYAGGAIDRFLAARD